MRPVTERPILVTLARADMSGLVDFAFALPTRLLTLFTDIGFRLNRTIPKDGSEAMTAALPLLNLAKADLPSASLWTGAIVAVNNEAGGFTIAFSDGTNWRRVQDRVIVS